ncbi:MAG: WG repeat-containing protein [Clostridiales bacterium]|nr:WG repeat-containing protein [Clostridiales bacterium]
MYGYINRAGEIVIAPEYDMALSFSEGCACVYKGERCGYINVKNEILVPLKYEAGTYVIDGNCRVKKEGRWGELLINNPEEIRWII